MTADTYEIYAVRYAHHHRLARESFLAADPHDDPLVLRRYPAPKPELEGIVVRLDVEPRA